MFPSVTCGRFFLAEWYRSELTCWALDDAMAQLERSASATSVGGALVRVLAVLAAPHDEVLYGVFAADCAQTVKRACRHAGFPVERFTEDVGARFAASVPPLVSSPTNQPPTTRRQ